MNSETSAPPPHERAPRDRRRSRRNAESIRELMAWRRAADEDAPHPDDEEGVQRAEDLRALFRERDAIGTPEERAGTHDYLMTALSETLRSEGRVF